MTIIHYNYSETELKEILESMIIIVYTDVTPMLGKV